MYSKCNCMNNFYFNDLLAEVVRIKNVRHRRWRIRMLWRNQTMRKYIINCVIPTRECYKIIVFVLQSNEHTFINTFLPK